MTTCQPIEISVVDGITFYETTARGVRYTAYVLCGRWFVATHRLALGNRHIGGGRYYDTAADVAKHVKALSGLDLIV
jgi:hypothetical protein